MERNKKTKIKVIIITLPLGKDMMQSVKSTPELTDAKIYIVMFKAQTFHKVYLTGFLRTFLPLAKSTSGWTRCMRCYSRKYETASLTATVEEVWVYSVGEGCRGVRGGPGVSRVVPSGHSISSL